MIDLGNVLIVILELGDVKSLNSMLVRNTERFKRFFPKTLEENLNIEMTKKYILKKKNID